MDIDVAALKGLVREKDLSLDLVVESIEAALLVAYQRTEGSQESARVQVDRKSGHVTVWARELDEEGEVVGEFDDTPRASAESPPRPPVRCCWGGYAKPKAMPP